MIYQSYSERNRTLTLPRGVQICGKSFTMKEQGYTLAITIVGKTTINLTYNHQQDLRRDIAKIASHYNFEPVTSEVVK